MHPKNPLIQMLLVKLQTLEQKHKTIVSFIWIPSHKGITDNEKADAAAKTACTLPAVTDLITVQDAFSYFKTELAKKWEQQWLYK